MGWIDACSPTCALAAFCRQNWNTLVQAQVSCLEVSPVSEAVLCTSLATLQGQ